MECASEKNAWHFDDFKHGHVLDFDCVSETEAFLSLNLLVYSHPKIVWDVILTINYTIWVSGFHPLWSSLWIISHCLFFRPHMPDSTTEYRSAVQFRTTVCIVTCLLVLAVTALAADSGPCGPLLVPWQAYGIFYPYSWAILAYQILHIFSYSLIFFCLY